MFVASVSNRFLSHLVPLAKRKRQTLLADSFSGKNLIGVKSELLLQHHSRFGPERKAIDRDLSRCFAT